MRRFLKRMSWLVSLRVVMDSSDPISKKKKYEAPAIIYEEVVEALAGTCGSGFDGIDTCRMGDAACDITAT